MNRPRVGSIAGSRLATSVVSSPAVSILAATSLAFPILEILLFRQHATQYVHDVFDGDLPALVALREDWLRHGLTFWDPHLTAGNAALAQLALPPFTPDILLSFVIPLFAAYTLTYVAVIWVAGFGMHLFLRDVIRLGRGAALVGAVMYACSFWHYIHGFAIPLLPFTLWLTDRWANATDGRGRLTLALVALAAFGLYTGLLQLQLLVAVTQGAFLLATRWDAGQRFRLLAGYVAIWAAALCLFAPVLVTQLVALGSSHRAVWDLEYLYPSAPLPAIRDTLDLFGSTLVGLPIDGFATGSAEYSGTFFLGGIGLLLLTVGAFAGGRDRVARCVLILVVSIPVLYLLALLATPLQAHIPVLNSFQFIRVSHLFPFALVSVAATGADHVLSGRWRANAVRWLPRSLLAALVAVLIVETGYAIRQTIELGSQTWLLGAIAVGGGTLAGVAVLTYAYRAGAHGRLGATAVAVILLVILGERLLFTRVERGLHAGLGTYAATMGIDRAMAYIADQPNPGMHRTLAAGTPSNRMLVASLYETGGYQSIYPLAYHTLFGALTAPYLATDPAMYRYFHDWGNRAAVFGPGLDPELLDLMGARWIYAKGMTFDAPQLKPAFESGQTVVYENPNVFPRAFIVSNVRQFASVDAVRTALVQATRGELRTTAFTLDSDGLGEVGGGDTSGSTGIIERYAPDRVEIRATASSPAILVLTDTFAPGWIATVDGVETPIHQVDLAYRAVAVPAGVSHIVFTYRPWFTYAGLAVAGTTAVLLIGLGAFAFRPVSRPRSGGRSSGGRTGPSRG